PAENPQRAIDFYSRVFGWKFTQWDGPMDYWLISTGQAPEPGIDGGLLKRRDPSQPCVNTIGVENLEKTIASVLSSGGSLALPKMPVPGVGWLAYCTDIDGNTFGMMQAVAAASAKRSPADAKETSAQLKPESNASGRIAATVGSAISRAAQAASHHCCAGAFSSAAASTIANAGSKGSR